MSLNFYSGFSLEGSSFEIFDANVNALENAQVVCLGERHSQDNYLKISRLVASLYQEGDIILVEGYEGNLSDRQKSAVIADYPDLRPDMNIEGWDSQMPCHYQMVSLSEDSDKIKAYIQDHPVLVEEEVCEFTRQLSPLTQAQIETLLKDLSCSLEEILYTVYNNLALLEIHSSVGDFHFLRNLSLARKIAEKSQSHRKVIVISGYNHFTAKIGEEMESAFPREINCVWLETQEIFRRATVCLSSVLLKHRYVILNTNSDRIS